VSVSVCVACCVFVLEGIHSSAFAVVRVACMLCCTSLVVASNQRQLRVVLCNPASGVSLDNALLLTFQGAMRSAASGIDDSNSRGRQCKALMTIHLNADDNDDDNSHEQRQPSGPHQT
jgi:hypothetical protein